MTTTAHSRGHQDALTADLLAKASAGDISAVETALGRFKGADAIAAARLAVDAARRADRWDNLAYLADFLHDVSAHGGRDGDDESSDGDSSGDRNVLGASKTVPVPVNVIPSARAARRVLVDCVEDVTSKPLKELDVSAVPDETWGKIQECTRMSILFDCVAAVTGKPPDEIAHDEVSAGDRAKIADCADASNLSYATLLKGAAAEMNKEGGADTAAATMADIPNLSGFVQNRVPVRTEVATFAVVDEDAPAGEYRSAEDPSPYVSISDPEEDISLMRGADDRVVGAPTIRVLYSYPFDTAGPTPEEKEAEGWIFEEKAPNGRFFTRAGLARAVAARYNAIYDEEAKTTAVEPGYIPGTLNRNRTNGRYGIWGHDIGDLVLHTVEHDPVTGVYTLGIDS